MADDVKRPFTILVPTDFSDQARTALRRALQLAAALGGKIVLLHAIDSGRTVASAVVAGFPELEDVGGGQREAASAKLRELAEGADPGLRTIERTATSDEPPVEAILDRARRDGADLIVMGSHGRGGVARLLLGSVAERVVRLAPCDVLIARGESSAVAPDPGTPPRA